MKHTDSPTGYRIAFQGLFSNHIPEISAESQDKRDKRDSKEAGLGHRLSRGLHLKL